jgi:hypothetical protein
MKSLLLVIPKPSTCKYLRLASCLHFNYLQVLAEVGGASQVLDRRRRHWARPAPVPPDINC